VRFLLQREYVDLNCVGRLLKQQLATCYQKEGVNHGVRCEAIRERYFNYMAQPNYGALRGGPDEKTPDFFYRKVDKTRLQERNLH